MGPTTWYMLWRRVHLCIMEKGEKIKKKRSPVIQEPTIWLYFRRGFTFGQFGRAHPYVWETEEGQPQIRKNSLFWMLSVIVTYVYTTFVWIRCIQKNLDPTVPWGMKIYLRFTVVYYSFPLLFHTSFMAQRGSILSLAITTIKFMQWIQENVKAESQSLMKRCRYFMIYIFYGFNSISVLVAVYAFLAPDSPEMVSSVLTDPNLLTRIVCGLFQGFIEYTFHSQCFMVIFMFCGCLFPSWALLIELRNWIKPRFGRKAHKFVMWYSSVHFIVQMASDVFLSFLIPVAYNMLVGLIVFCTYSSARLEGFIALSLGFMGFILTVFVVVFMGTLAEVYELSMKIKRDLRKMGFCNRKRILGKRLRSLPPIKLEMGSSYYVDKVHVLTIIDIILQSSISFLIGNGTN